MQLIWTDETQTARANGTPLVALESTIITHGMPYPQNVETAAAVEDEIRKKGACPATIAVWDGAIRIGLEPSDRDWLGQQTGALKLSRADLGFALASGALGSTTVAATMIAAHLAGIEVFATGGIGGVHKGAETSFDISADLQELAQTPVNVVCAGAKAILDIPKTLEVLETLGVPVITYGAQELPAFWSRSSGLQSPLTSDDTRDIAAAFRTRQALGLSGGQLIANPIPLADEIAPKTLAPIIAQAQSEAEAKGISAKDVTPFLLQRIFELTDGASLTANVALIRNNARLAAELAIALAQLEGTR